MKEILNNKSLSNFRTALMLSLAFLLLLGIWLSLQTKRDAFFLLHEMHSTPTDYFFWAVTHLGDGLMVIPVFLYTLVWQRNKLLTLILTFLICIVLTQVFKKMVFPDVLRPVSLELENFTLRRVLGLELHGRNSFPSGHTATAFALALFLSLLVNNRIWAFLLPMIAIAVGYSRVYLAQHFPTDVLAGAAIGTFSAFAGLLIALRTKYSPLRT